MHGVVGDVAAERAIVVDAVEAEALRDGIDAQRLRDLDVQLTRKLKEG